MTPQEQALIDELFDRLASLENNPRDSEAERAIVDGLRRAPHATYALVQTALVQDEALKRASARIEELQAQLDGGAQQEQHQGSFLDSMREAVLGKSRGSVPSVRSPAPQPPPMEPPPMAPPPMGSGPFGNQQGYYPQMPTGPAFGSGGSFLGSAASTAAGVIGGALLMDGIRSMFGHHAGGTQSAFGGVGGSSDSGLAREAGINDIDRGGADYRQRQLDQEQDRQQDLDDDRQQALDRQQDADQDADDFADDDGSFGGDDSDFA
jgi:uncharacterized protein